MTNPKTNARDELPECPDYIAHPQSVWFETYWRPILEARERGLKWHRDELSRTYHKMDAEWVKLLEIDHDKWKAEADRLRTGISYLGSENKRLRSTINLVLADASGDPGQISILTYEACRLTLKMIHE